ncbi:MAG TPA: AsmA family protein [Acidisoma sp.]|uniref:AsmA family protein n=1 Tax=Acidisoma sp. TaxID=1872115 RepID=UPI002CE4BD0E|nr:AsmA family protein [Acidisoma sp.]HTI02494.1 AsmA family protein [Acidisoma sp.]
MPRQRPRRRRVRLLPLLFGALVVLVGLLWIGPGLLDWSAHRGAVATVASELIGREVDINGPIHLSLLPQPSITAEKVEVRDDADGVRMATAALTLNLSLGALLTGRIAVTHLVLDHPDVHLPWPLPSGPLSIEPPPWLAALSADIDHGTFSVGALRMTDANVSVVTGGVDTALAIDGTAQAGGLPWKASLALSWTGSDGSAPLHIALQSPGNPSSSFDLKARMTTDGMIDGQFTAHGTNLAAIFPGPEQPFDAAGRLRADGRQLRLSDLHLTLGSMPADGHAEFGLTPSRAETADKPSLVVSLHTPLLDLGPWLTSFPKHSTAAIPMTLDLGADAAVYGDGLLRHFGVKLQTSRRRLRVDALQATLPGEAELTLAGLYDPAAEAFSGQMKLAAPAPLVTLHWLTEAHFLPDLSGALLGLGNLALDAKVNANTARLALTGIDGQVNDTSVSGGLVLTRGADPRLSAGLSFGRIDLDQWLPPAWLMRPPRPADLAQALTGVTADLQLSAGELWLGGDRIDHALFDADLGRNGLNLRQFAGQYGGMQILAAGALDPKGVVRNARVVLAAPHASPLTSLLPPSLRNFDPSFWDAPFAANMTASGPPGALALSLQGSLGDLDFSAQPMLDLQHGSWKGVLTLQHPSATRLLTQLGFGYAGTWLGEGSLSIVANAAADHAGWSLSPFTFSAGLLHGSGRLAQARARPPEDRKILGTVMIDTLPWPAPQMDDPLPLGLLRGWRAGLSLKIGRVTRGLTALAQDVSAYADVTDGVLRLAIERAGFSGGNAFGTVRLDSATPPTLTADLALSGASLASKGDGGTQSLAAWLPVAASAARLDAHGTIQMQGYSLASWLASLTATAGFEAAHGTLSGLQLSEAAAEEKATEQQPAPRMPKRMRDSALFSGNTPFDAMTGTFSVAQGDLTLASFGLAGQAGTVTAQGQVDLVRGACNLNLTLQPAGAPNALTAVLQGPIGKPAAWLVRGMTSAAPVSTAAGATQGTQAASPVPVPSTAP